MSEISVTSPYSKDLRESAEAVDKAIEAYLRVRVGQVEGEMMTLSSVGSLLDRINLAEQDVVDAVRLTCKNARTDIVRQCSRLR